jgi:hypothetical protein
MAANNLRIIYKNLVDTATIAASTTAGVTSAANLKLDAKSLVWRSTGASATLTVTLAASSTISGVILPFTNLGSTATVTVTLSNGYTTGAVLCAPYSGTELWNPASIPTGTSTYSYGGGTYARVWFPKQTNITSVTIVINSNVGGYIEVSRLIIGDYWSPTYNTSYGLSAQLQDLSSHQRSESGDLITNRGTIHKTMSFTLDYLDASDRVQLISLLKNNGIYKPIFVSLFPDNSTDYTKEDAHQIYGKLSQLSPITHPVLSFYSSNMDIEEI